MESRSLGKLLFAALSSFCAIGVKRRVPLEHAPIEAIDHAS
jgi:hypothetical protein